jgi:bacterioferritin (cytochrome b1)
MKALSKEQTIETLNHDLIAELSAEEGHAQELTRRIKELGGEPAQPGGEATIAGRAVGAASAQASTIEMLKLELGEEQQAIKDYSAQIADIVDDDHTVTLLGKHLQDEMEHARWLEAQIRALEKRG